MFCVCVCVFDIDRKNEIKISFYLFFCFFPGGHTGETGGKTDLPCLCHAHVHEGISPVHFSFEFVKKAKL